MNAIDPALPVIRAFVDAEGRLIEAEDRLHALNARAGGAIGAPLAVPQLAMLARLAQRLGIVVTRTVVAADGNNDLELLARAVPQGDGVSLEIAGWRSQVPWRPNGGEDGFGQPDGDWSWETDAALNLAYLPADAGPRFGFDAGAMLGQPLTRLFALQGDDSGTFPILGAVAAHAPFEGQRAEVRGTGHMVRISAAPRFDADGRFSGFAGVAEPLESRRTPEPPTLDTGGFPDSFSRRLDRALRAPLGKIIAQADGISARADGPLQADYAEYAADIANAGRHLLGLIDDLVDLQAVEREDFRVAAEPIDLADVARRATGLLGVRAAKAQVTIERPHGEESLPVTGEFRRALQVMVNLVGNAVRYSPPGSTVSIRLDRQGGLAQAVVADQGRGIAVEEHERIFEKFVRIDPGEHVGSGLGLYIARRLARAMGGDIAVESVPGDGARFIFSLPLRG